MVKKEFKKDDVQRMRNLIQGKHGEKTKTSVGFTETFKQHKEGDVWEVNGVMWTIKDGIKQNVTKLDMAREITKLPLFCPKCEGIMNNRNDKDFYPIHGTCYECVILMEHDLKKQGKWEKYKNKIHNEEIDNKIKDFKDWIEEKKSEGNNSFFSENGEMEKWEGEINEEKVNIYTKSVVEYLEKQKI